MTAGRVADGDHPVGRQAEARPDGRQVIDPVRHVDQRARPAAARFADAAVLEVPDRVAPGREVDGEREHDAAVVAVPPEAAVEQHDDRVRAGTVGEMERALLARTGPVGVD